MKYNKTTKQIISIILTTVILMTGCSQKNSQPNNTSTNTGGKEPEVISIKAVADPSIYDQKKADPYKYIPKFSLSIGDPNKELYNKLFDAVDKGETTVDVSGFNLTNEEKDNTAASLYGDANFHLFYYSRYKMSEDGKTITFKYVGNPQEYEKNKKEFQSRFQHMLYNVAPEQYDGLQKLVSVFNYICENCNYGNISDEEDHKAYSILMNGRGICGGYSRLMEYVLNKIGVETECVGSTGHAWNMVKLNGKWFQTDVTFAAGEGSEIKNSMNTLLMDDTERAKTMKEEYHLGSSVEPIKPPACTDKSFSAYSTVGSLYAFDIENKKVYTGSELGINSMNLDCTNNKTILQGVKPDMMTFFNGTLYYTDSKNGFLYKLIPGEKAEIMDDSKKFLSLQLKGTKLLYSTDSTGKDAKQVELLPCPEEIKTTKVQYGENLKKTDSHSFQIEFSEPMDKAQNWNEKIYMVDDKKNTVQLHFLLDETGKKLTVRPKTLISDFTGISLYVKSGTDAENGKKIAKNNGMEWMLSK
jgi:hypothetical protein